MRNNKPSIIFLVECGLIFFHYIKVIRNCYFTFGRKNLKNFEDWYLILVGYRQTIVFVVIVICGYFFFFIHKENIVNSVHWNVVHTEMKLQSCLVRVAIWWTLCIMHLSSSKSWQLMGYTYLNNGSFE